MTAVQNDHHGVILSCWAPDLILLADEARKQQGMAHAGDSWSHRAFNILHYILQGPNYDVGHTDATHVATAVSKQYGDGAPF
jgi:hypothetical protein